MYYETETEVGDVEIPCPLCEKIIKSGAKGYESSGCPLCEGKGEIIVYVGEVSVSGEIDYEPDYSWRD